MTYCNHCGEKVPEDAFYCPKCGTKTAAGVEAKGSTPSEEMREAFNKMSVELEKAFNVAAKEIQEAFQLARANIQKAVHKEPLVCSSCGEANQESATYCHKCGKKLSA